MKQHAFTLIELLIVVLIIAILAAIAVPNFLEFQTRAKVARCKNDMRSLATGIEGYFVEFDAYPPCNTFALSGNCTPAGCTGQDLPVLERISTPVAFITTGVMPDCFLSKFFTGSGLYDGSEGDGSGLPGTGNNYPLEDPVPAGKVLIYASVSSDERADFDVPAGSDSTAIAWVLGSVGPDLIRINLGGILANNGISQDARGFETKLRYCLNLLYDPTNGTVSWGEIYRTGGDINRDYGAVFLRTGDIHK